MAIRPYKRLPGRNFALFNSAALWEADDHLLLVESHRVSESYKRFFYRDIQAVVICQTKTGLVRSLMLGVLALIFGVLSTMADFNSQIVLGLFAGLFFILAVVDFLRGPTCQSRLRTAVQTQDLPSLNRLRTARKVLQRIQPKIATAQQETSPQ